MRAEEPGSDRFQEAVNPDRDGLLRSVAHELRTPLQGLRMLVEVLRRSAEARRVPDASLRRRIDAEFDRLAELVDELSEAEGGVYPAIGEPLDLAVILRRLAEGRNEMLRVPAMRAALVLRYRGPEHAELVGDGRRLRQTFAALLDNAVKFSPRGGIIEVRLEADRREIRVQVCDQGIGIPAVEIPLAARKFFRGSNAPRENFPGTGLGLARARDVVEQHGGSLEIESEVDRGTCVTARFPLEAGAP